MVVNGVQKYRRINLLQRPLLPLLSRGKYLICDSADHCVGDLYTVNMADMGFNIRRSHPSSVHGEDLSSISWLMFVCFFFNTCDLNSPLRLRGTNTSTSPNLVRRIFLLCPLRCYRCPCSYSHIFYSLARLPTRHPDRPPGIPQWFS